MTREYLKKATLTSRSDSSETAEIVSKILAEIEAGGEEKALEYAAKFDKYEGNIILSAEEIEAAGGATVIPETPIPDGGSFAWFTDPGGNTLGLHKSAQG